MKDRVSKQPGRVLISPENGSPAFYATMTRADEPTQAGDPINKTTLLTDTVAAMFGWGAEAVPNDVAGYVGQYAQHQWFRKRMLDFFLVPESKYTTLLMHSSNKVAAGTNYVFYKEAYLDPNQEIELIGGSTYSVNHPYYSDLYKRVGEYFEKDGAVYYLDSGSVVTRNFANDTYYVYATARKMVVEDRSGQEPDTYLYSSDVNAYPHSGESDGYTYSYLGRAMEHVRREPMRVLRGSYYGTGEFGAATPQRIELPFKKLLALFVVKDSSTSPSLVWVGQPGPSSIHFTEKEGAAEWYGTSAAAQLNEDAVFYHYIAIGIDSDREEN